MLVFNAVSIAYANNSSIDSFFSLSFDSVEDEEVDDDEIVKVHIHTNNPDVVLCEALKIGDLSSVKVENMKINPKDYSLLGKVYLSKSSLEKIKGIIPGLKLGGEVR